MSQEFRVIFHDRYGAMHVHAGHVIHLADQHLFF